MTGRSARPTDGLPALWLGAMLGGLLVSAAVAAEPIALPVLVKALDEVEVPAREAGVLSAIEAREGTLVDAGTVLARIEDSHARLMEARARLEMEIAAKNAASEIGVISAEKTRVVAESELQRANDALKRFPNSISRSELDRLALDAEKAELAIRQAKLDRQIAQATEALKRSECELAALGVERRTISSPLSGMVVEVLRRPGEWVEPGDVVLRVLRLDRLRAEGFLDVQSARQDLLGHRVQLTTELPEEAEAVYNGTIVFVSPEVDPINRQVRVLAEIDNHLDLTLRPGLRGAITISRAERSR